MQKNVSFFFSQETTLGHMSTLVIITIWLMIYKMVDLGTYPTLRAHKPVTMLWFLFGVYPY